MSASMFLGLAIVVGLRYLAYRNVPDDQISFYWYNVRYIGTAHH